MIYPSWIWFSTAKATLGQVSEVVIRRVSQSKAAAALGALHHGQHDYPAVCFPSQDKSSVEADVRSVTFMVHLAAAQVDDCISKTSPVPVEAALVRMHCVLIRNQAIVSPPFIIIRQDCPSK